MPNLNNIFVHFAPELILTLGILVVLGYDLVVRGRDGAQAWLAIGTLVLALIATLFLWTQPATSIFEARSVIAPYPELRAGSFVSDGFTNFFRLLGLMATLLVLMSGIAYMRGRTPFKGEFYALVLAAALAMNLMAGANDLIIIALSIEFLSITSYILTAYLRDDPLSQEGGLKYFLYGSITSAAMLYGLTLVYGATGSTSLPVIAEVTSNSGYMLTSGLTAVLLPGIILIVAGIGFKIALVPFHQWSPDAYQGAPTPITAFLSVGPKAAGFAVLLRLMLTAFGASVLSSAWLPALAALAVLTMIVGNFGALTQNNVKRMMAYSSIAQAGYMLVGLVALSSGQLTGVNPVGAVLLYLLAYLFTNLGGFAVITAVDHATGSSDIAAFNGLIRRSPFLAVSLAIFFLSLVGIPPLAGFIGKFAVFGAAMASGQVMIAVIGVLTGVVSVGYYFRVMKAVFFGPVAEDAEGGAPIRVAPALMFVIPVALLMVFAIGLMPGPFFAMANQAAAVVAPVMEAVAGH
jgi:NADH-quinone oxidoreductase subunit N